MPLADRLRNHVQEMAAHGFVGGAAAWNRVSNDMLIAADMVTAPAPISTAPRRQVLAYWPRLKLDENDCTTAERLPGTWYPSEFNGQQWEGPEWMDAAGSYFGDDWVWADEPTHWLPVPAHPEDL